MVNKNKLLKEAKKLLIGVYNPIEIYLFGSYAWGTPTKDSDLDFLIVVEESDKKSYKRSIPGDLALVDLLVSRDIVVSTKEEFEQRASDVTTLCYKIKKDGERIYAKA